MNDHSNESYRLSTGCGNSTFHKTIPTFQSPGQRKLSLKHVLV